MRNGQSHLDVFHSSAEVERLASLCAEGSRTAGARPWVSVGGSTGSSTTLLAGALALRTRATERGGRCVVLVVAHLDDADEALEDLAAVGVEAVRLPALEMLPGESAVSLDLFAERVSVVRRVIGAGGKGQNGRGVPAVLVCPIQSLMQAVPEPSRLDALTTIVRTGDRRKQGDLVRWLDAAGYRRVESVEEPGDFAVRGGILDVFPPTGAARDGSSEAAVAARLDFFGDEVESITEIDLATLGSGPRLSEVELVGAKLDAAASDDGTMSFLELLPPESIAMVQEPIECTEQGRGYFERVSDARGIFGPPAVFKLLRDRFAAFVEVSQYAGAGSAGGVASSGPSSFVELPVRSLPEFARDASAAVGELGEMTAMHHVLVLCQNEAEQQRLRELIAEFGGAGGPAISSAVAYLHRGFVWGAEGDAPHSPSSKPHALIPYHELLHRYQTRRRIRRLKAGRSTDAFLEIAIGDFVVHADHGIAKFLGLKTMRPLAPKAIAEQEAAQVMEKHTGKGRKKKAEPEPAAHESSEYLVLEFAGRSRLHVPVSQIDKVQKYIGGFAGKPPLSTLGGKRWQTQKDQVRESVRDMAAELLRVQAARSSMPGVRFPADTAWQKEFEAEFPYQETEDQVASLLEIKKDMTTDRPMDRLLCGDVGYGKTEMAIRAAFKAAEFGKQVAVLVPTTLLAEQHERTFKSRFADYPFRVESLSRFKTTKEINDILAATRKGQVDILIGTHRILSKDVRFADLGLVVIDEEQRFGVEHKNALLALRLTVDVLTLSATPIPRTLHMSMLGLRDISSLSTPPLDRRAVVTEVAPYNTRRIQQAISRELAREGQVFFVHNRVNDIKSVADDIQKLAPDARIVIGHGQMPDGELEEVMAKFIARDADILVSTTIVESGIDIPTANTMFINNADKFGLAELHQLRGRVGRYKHRAYCYLLLPSDKPPTDIAVRRLRAIEEFSMLGAGFKIAMRDLEIRGAGNLLGAEQSGHISAVGYEMYCRLLDHAAKELQQESTAEPSDTTVEIGLSGSLPKTYIPSETRRLEAYRRIGAARAAEELRRIEEDLRTAYGELPPTARVALDLAEVRIAAMGMGVRSIALHEQDVIFRTRDTRPVLAALEGVQGSVRAISSRPGETMQEVYFRPPASYLEGPTLLAVLRKRLAGAVRV